MTNTIYFSSRHSRHRVNWINRLNRIYSHKGEEEEKQKTVSLVVVMEVSMQSLRKLFDFKWIITQTKISYSKININDSVFQPNQINDRHIFIDLVIS